MKNLHGAVKLWAPWADGIEGRGRRVRTQPTGQVIGQARAEQMAEVPRRRRDFYNPVPATGTTYKQS